MENWQTPMNDALMPYQRDMINRMVETKIQDLRKLSTFRMTHGWREALSRIHLNRGFQKMDGEMLNMMGTVGASKSPALLYLAENGKKVGVEYLYRIETSTKDEKLIESIANLVLKVGVKEAQNDVDLMLASGEPMTNLFNMETK